MSTDDREEARAQADALKTLAFLDRARYMDQPFTTENYAQEIGPPVEGAEQLLRAAGGRAGLSASRPQGGWRPGTAPRPARPNGDQL